MFGFCGSFGILAGRCRSSRCRALPSRPNAMRDVPARSSTRMSFTSVSALPSKRPRAMRDRPALLVERLGVRQIDEPVLRELRMERDVHVAMHGSGQSRLSGPVRCRRAGDRLRIEHAVSNHPQAAGALGDEHGAVRKKRQRPRIFERAGHRGHANALTLAGVELDRLCGQLVAGKPRRRDRNAAAGTRTFCWPARA